MLQNGQDASYWHVVAAEFWRRIKDIYNDNCDNFFVLFLCALKLIKIFFVQCSIYSVLCWSPRDHRRYKSGDSRDQSYQSSFLWKQFWDSQFFGYVIWPISADPDFLFLWMEMICTSSHIKKKCLFITDHSHFTKIICAKIIFTKENLIFFSVPNTFSYGFGFPYTVPAQKSCQKNNYAMLRDQRHMRIHFWLIPLYMFFSKKLVRYPYHFLTYRHRVDEKERFKIAHINGNASAFLLVFYSHSDL